MINPLDTAKKPEPITIGKPEPKPEQAILATNTIVEEAEMHALGHVLGLDKQSELHRYQDQTRRIMDWAKAKGAQSITDIVAEVNSLKGRLGGHDIFSLSIYTGLELERMAIEAKLRKFEK